MPVVLDDILIHFDDERARAALEVLGTIASTMQVIFFTHHARLVELARLAFPAAAEGVGGAVSVVVHELATGSPSMFADHLRATSAALP
jgi:hypothetical protein